MHVQDKPWTVTGTTPVRPSWTGRVKTAAANRYGQEEGRVVKTLKYTVDCWTFILDQVKHFALCACHHLLFQIGAPGSQTVVSRATSFFVPPTQLDGSLLGVSWHDVVVESWKRIPTHSDPE